MRPELTEQQRQAVREQPDRPVEVVDSTTNRTYVLLSQELYDQVLPLLGQAAQGATRAAATLSSSEVGPLRQRLKDLPTPPEVAEAAARRSRELGLLWKSQWQTTEEELKLQYYYGGQCVAYLRTKDGKVIVAAGRRDSDAFDRQLSYLTPEERSRTVQDWPSRWDDPESQILSG